jgi:peroxisomal membrane protein 4
MSSIAHWLSDPRLHDYLAIVKGARNGFVYGVKVRFPHALIMAVLFGRGEYVFRSTSELISLLDHRHAAGDLAFS